VEAGDPLEHLELVETAVQEEAHKAQEHQHDQVELQHRATLVELLGTEIMVEQPLELLRAAVAELEQLEQHLLVVMD